MKPQPRRIRPLLLVLLWIWAGCIALVLDLFLDVPEFDEVRPRAPLYRAMRSVAHDMVGEPLPDEEPVTRTVQRRWQSPRAEAPAVAWRDDALLVARPGSRHPGGKPDARTPQGEKLRSDLIEAARSAGDPAERHAAVRSLARMFGRQADDALSGIAEDPAQPADVRDLAANLRRQTAEGRK